MIDRGVTARCGLRRVTFFLSPASGRLKALGQGGYVALKR